MDPLQVTITGISPSVIPRRGPLELSGTLTNVSDETWSLINLYAVVSSTPIGIGRDLELNAQTDPALQVGNRIVEDDTDTFDVIEELVAGASAPYSLKVPHDVLTSYISQPAAPGVYWLGVQALGQTTEGRDNLFGGRAADSQAPVVHPVPAEADGPGSRRAGGADPAQRVLPAPRPAGRGAHLDEGSGTWRPAGQPAGLRLPGLRRVPSPG